MKKILLGGVFIAGSVLAEDAESASSKQAEVAVNTASEEVVADTVQDQGHGFYVGGGLCYIHSDHKIRATDGVLGNGNAYRLDVDISHQSVDKLGGSLVLGWGKHYKKFYGGVEALLDCVSDEKIEEAYPNGGNNSPYYARVRGLVPSLGIRLGYQSQNLNSLIYLKPGIAYVRAEYQEKSDSVVQNTRKIEKIAPTLALGIEKNVRDRINVRGEFDYRFQVKKTDRTEYPGISSFNVERRLKGFGFRLLATYNF